MSIAYMEVRTVSRSRGQSAVAAAAYRSAQRLEDTRTGLTHDYRRRRGVTHRALVGWSRTRAELWQAAELAEKRKDAKVAREIILALPAEIGHAERVALVMSYARWLNDRHGMAIDIAVHAPSKSGDQRNCHAHLLLTTRRAVDQALTEKLRDLDVSTTSSGHVEAWREEWGRLCSIDMRSYARQGSQNVGQVHLGPAAAELARKGQPSERADLNQEIRDANKSMADLRSMLVATDSEIVLVRRLDADSTADAVERRWRERCRYEQQRLLEDIKAARAHLAELRKSRLEASMEAENVELDKRRSAVRREALLLERRPRGASFDFDDAARRLNDLEQTPPPYNPLEDIGVALSRVTGWSWPLVLAPNFVAHQQALAGAQLRAMEAQQAAVDYAKRRQRRLIELGQLDERLLADQEERTRKVNDLDLVIANLDGHIKSLESELHQWRTVETQKGPNDVEATQVDTASSPLSSEPALPDFDPAISPDQIDLRN